MLKRCVLLLALAACGSSKKPASCQDRVAKMAASLSSPRSLDELLERAPADVRADLDEAAKAPVGLERMTTIARILVRVSADCPEAAKAFADVGTLEGPVQKDDFLRERIPPAIEACQCKASPERVGSLFEALFREWSR